MEINEARKSSRKWPIPGHDQITKQISDLDQDQDHLKPSPFERTEINVNVLHAHFAKKERKEKKGEKRKTESTEFRQHVIFPRWSTIQVLTQLAAAWQLQSK